jgi:hypothetical protein
MIPQRLKNGLKDINLINVAWSAYRSRQQNRRIENEQHEYEQRALKMGIPLVEEPVSHTYRKLRERLAVRGLSWPPNPKDRPLHVVFCSPSSDLLEQAHIPTEISRLCEVTEYYVHDRRNTPVVSLTEHRRFVRQDLSSFLKRILSEKPIDLILSYLGGTDMTPDTLSDIRKMGIPTFFFHQDDRLLFRGTKTEGQWTGCADVCAGYDLCLTNSPLSLIKYRVEGALALFWPSAADRDLCKPREKAFKYDISFIGAKYGRRPSLVNHLRSNGINVECFGPGWDNGPLTPDQMMDVYSQSRINLGSGYIGYSSHQCLKGRDFEVPICGTVYLTSYNDDLHRVYRLEEEIVTYTDERDCLTKIQTLLANPERCVEIRKAARKAGLERHTREIRFRALLECKESVPW